MFEAQLNQPSSEHVAHVVDNKPKHVPSQPSVFARFYIRMLRPPKLASGIATGNQATKTPFTIWSLFELIVFCPQTCKWRMTILVHGKSAVHACALKHTDMHRPRGFVLNAGICSVGRTRYWDLQSINPLLRFTESFHKKWEPRV